MSEAEGTEEPYAGQGRRPAPGRLLATALLWWSKALLWWSDVLLRRSEILHRRSDSLRRRADAARLRAEAVLRTKEGLVAGRLFGPLGAALQHLRPFSIKTKLGTLVVVSVFITTGLMTIAVRTETELRFITVFSMIATLLITQFVAHSLTTRWTR